MVRGLGWVSFLTDAASDLIYPLLPALLRSMGAGGEALGIVEGVADSFGALVKWQAGKTSDRFSRKKPLVVFGYTVAAIVRPMSAIAMAPWHVVIVRSIDRFGKGVRSAPRDALLAAAVKPEQRALAFAYHRMFDNAGAVLGPLLAFFLTKALGLSVREVFACAIVPGLLAVALLVFRVREEPDASADKATPEVIAPSPPLPRSLVAYLGLVALFTLGASADSFLLLRMSDLGLPAAYLPIAWMSLNLVRAATNVPGGRFADRIGRRRALVLAWLLYAVAYAAFPLTQSIALTWLLLLFYGGYYGLAEGAEKAIVADHSPARARGKAFGALHAVTGLAVLPANALFGALYGMKLVHVAFFASAACAGLAALGLAALRFKKETER